MENIIVCIKQVPGTSEVNMDEHGNLIRSGVDSKMNPFDLFALETAMQIKSTADIKIKALSMGPPQAKKVLNEALWMGADEGILLSDRKFAGADVWATSYALAQSIKKEGVPDLLICGKQTTDGDTAQVGAEMAEFLGIPHITNVKKIVEVKDNSIVVEADLPTLVQIAEIAYPCLITVEKDIYVPRLPSYRRKKMLKESKKKAIRTLSFVDLADKNEFHYGMKGSPTKVKRVFLPEGNTEHELWSGDEKESASKLSAYLKGLKII